MRGTVTAVIAGVVEEGGTGPPVAWQDWIALIIAGLALVLTIWSARHSSRTALDVANRTIESRRDNFRAANYARLHEMLVDPKAAHGRRALFQAAARRRFPRHDRSRESQDWDDINYSLALYDTLGGYIARDLVDPHVVLDAWHHPLRNITQPVLQFMEHRRQSGITQPWSFLLHLLDLASTHPCTCPSQPGFSGGPGQ